MLFNGWSCDVNHIKHPMNLEYKPVAFGQYSDEPVTQQAPTSAFQVLSNAKVKSTFSLHQILSAR